MMGSYVDVDACPNALYTLRAIVRATDCILIWKATKTSYNVWDVWAYINIQDFFLSSFVCATVYDHSIIYSSDVKPLKRDKSQKKN